MRLDNETLAKLWDEITPKLFGYLVNVTRNPALAEDLLQNTWTKAIEALSKYQNRGIKFSSWLFAIARNECRQHWRKSNREISFDPALHDTESKDNNPEDKMLVNQLLAKLSEDDRELIRLRFIADLPVDQIAQILRLNPIAARVRLHRALIHLKSYATINQ
ncbi:MAG: sigma-70 family RNA polymerase sigma factor [Patescibacteria group bacterium]